MVKSTRITINKTSLIDNELSKFNTEKEEPTITTEDISQPLEELTDTEKQTLFMTLVIIHLKIQYENTLNPNNYTSMV